MALTPVYSGPDIPKILIFVFYEHQINGQGIRDPIIDSLPSINWQIQLAVHAILFFHQMTTLSIPSPQQRKIKEGVDKRIHSISVSAVINVEIEDACTAKKYG